MDLAFSSSLTETSPRLGIFVSYVWGIQIIFNPQTVSQALRLFLSPRVFWSHMIRYPICAPSRAMLLSPQGENCLRFGLGFYLISVCPFFSFSLSRSSEDVASPMARGGPCQRPPPASILWLPAARHTLSSFPSCSAVSTVPPPVPATASPLSADSNGEGPRAPRASASPHPGVAAAAPSGPNRELTCGDRDRGKVTELGNSARRRGPRGRARACPPPRYAKRAARAAGDTPPARP